MSDRFLFVIVPYLAALVFVPVCLVRYVVWLRQPEQAGPEFPTGERSGRIDVTWRSAIAVVALGHGLAFAFPDFILRWNQHPLRLLLLEASGLIAGGIALVGLLAILGRRLCAFDRHGAPSPVDVIAGTLILIELVSGIAIAVLYRWGSSWSGVTLAPYLDSILRLEPSTILVARLPLLVKLHVFCAFALLGVAPFTRQMRFVILPLDRLTLWTAARGSQILHPAWCAVEDWTTKRMQPLRAMVFPNEGEEN